MERGKLVGRILENKDLTSGKRIVLLRWTRREKRGFGKKEHLQLQIDCFFSLKWAGETQSCALYVGKVRNFFSCWAGRRGRGFRLSIGGSNTMMKGGSKKYKK